MDYGNHANGLFELIPAPIRAHLDKLKFFAILEALIGATVPFAMVVGLVPNLMWINILVTFCIITSAPFYFIGITYDREMTMADIREAEMALQTEAHPVAVAIPPMYQTEETAS